MEFQTSKFEQEPWQLAIALQVQMCHPQAPVERRERISNAIGAQLVEVTIEDARRNSPESVVELRNRLSARFPNYTAEARRGISERYGSVRPTV